MKFLDGGIYKTTILPAAILSGTIIGAGIFSLPYIFSQAGWIISAVYMLGLSLVFYFVHVMYADILLRSGENFKFVGYAKQYLGELAFWMSILVTVIGSLLTLTAYLVLANNFFNIIFPTIPFFATNISLFWVIASVAVFISIKKMARLEFYITAGMILIIFFIFAFGLLTDPARVAALPQTNWPLAFLPFGAILFSLSGRTAVPALIEYYENNQLPFDNFKRVVFLGTITPAIVYLLFVVGIIGISPIITKDSIAVFASLPFIWPAAIGILGLLSLLSSYIVIGLSIDEILNIDLRVPKLLSRIVVVLVPLAFIFLGFNDFIKVITLAGGIFLALEGIIVVSMWRRVEKLQINQFLFIRRPLPEFIAYILLAIFFLGVLYTAVF